MSENSKNNKKSNAKLTDANGLNAKQLKEIQDAAKDYPKDTNGNIRGRASVAIEVGDQFKFEPAATLDAIYIKHPASGQIPTWYSLKATNGVELSVSSLLRTNNGINITGDTEPEALSNLLTRVQTVGLHIQVKSANIVPSRRPGEDGRRNFKFEVIE